MQTMDCAAPTAGQWVWRYVVPHITGGLPIMACVHAAFNGEWQCSRAGKLVYSRVRVRILDAGAYFRLLIKVIFSRQCHLTGCIVPW